MQKSEDELCWRLRLNGSPSLWRGDTRVPLGRKSAGLLTYLALHGAAPRARLAHLLWPDLEAQGARSSLRGLLFELKRFSGLLSASDPLQLSSAVQLEHPNGELLEGFDYDDLPEFAEWLAYQRRLLRERHVETLAADLRTLEREGVFADAIPLAKRLVDLEPLSEAAHRALMRLLYLSGDRAAALAAYRACRELLRLELRVEPLPETAALALDIERGTKIPATSQRRPEIPLSVAKPPVLVGREREWARMEAAWARGQVILIAGPAGVGKTRLMLDFAASKGEFFYIRARPGQSTVPFSSCAHFVRGILEYGSRFGLELEPWMRRDLSRLVPELAEGSRPPFGTVDDARRVTDAISALIARTRAYVATALTDDLHFLDLESLKAGSRVISEHARINVGEKGQWILAAMRLDEMNPDYARDLHTLVELGLAVWIELQSLNPTGVREMLASIDVSGVQALTEPLHKLTGGNPLFIVETLKGLIESGELDKGEVRAVFPEKVGAILEGRFRRLSGRALRLLELGAVAQGDFSPELAAQVLGVSRLKVSEWLAELEAARMLKGADFSHDLVYEAVKRGTPRAMTTFFHGACAHFLAAHGGAAARVAYHFWEAGEVQRALPYYLNAVETALVQGAFAQAKTWLERVLEHAQEGTALHTEARAKLVDLTK